MDEDLPDFLAALVRQAPLYLVLFGAVVFSLARHERNPPAAFWAGLGCGWLLLTGLAGDVWREFHLSESFVPDAVANVPGPGFEWLAYALTSSCLSLVQSFGVVFLMVAVAAGVNPRRYQYSTFDDHDAHRDS